MRSFLSPILAAALIISCSKKESSSAAKPTKEKSSLTTMTEESSDVRILEELVSSESSNIALVELLVKTLGKEDQKHLHEVLKDLSSEEADQIIAEVQKQNLGIRKHFLFHGQKYQNLTMFMNSTLTKESSIGDLSVTSQLKVTTFNYLKNKTLAEIVSTYDSRASELTQDLAADLAIDIGTKNPQVAQEIEEAFKNEDKNKVIQIIQKARPVVEKVDEYFKNSNLNENEQFTVLFAGAIAGGIYTQLEKNKDFRHIVDEGKRILRDAKALEKKAKEALVLIKALNKHAEDTAKSIKDFKDGMTSSRDDLNELFQEARVGVNNPSNVHSKRIFDFLYQNVIQGKKPGQSTNPSILSKQTRINEGVVKSVTAVGDIADNLSNILTTTRQLSGLLGVKLPKDLEKFIDKAQKVSALATTAKVLMTGWMTGGPLGAMTALSSSPVMSLMGGGGSPESAKLDAIDKKLDIIIEYQRKIMEMQIETMKMIKDLALLVDRYHQEEMVALAELRDISLVSLEINKTQLNKDIRSCERIVNFQLQSFWDRFDFGNESFYSINHLQLVSSIFYSKINSLNDIRRVMTSTESTGFQKCQEGISEAFGGNSGVENPIRAIYSSTDQDNLTKFEREKYGPLLESLLTFAGTSNFNSIPLHFPLRDIRAVKHKAPFLDYAKRDSTSGTTIYDLDNLISVKALERYLGNLLIMYPLLEVDKDIWFENLETIVGTYSRNSNVGDHQNIRSFYFLNNALKLVQSAIAQESILAGEPILHRIYENSSDLISGVNCQDVKSKTEIFSESLPYACALRSNTLLMKNYVMYILHRQDELTNDFQGRYEFAYNGKDLQSLAKLTGLNIDAKNLKIEKSVDAEDIVIQVQVIRDRNVDAKTLIKLPTPEQFSKGTLLYSENMSRLLVMQDLILNQLEKVVPASRNSDQRILDLLFVKSAI